MQPFSKKRDDSSKDSKIDSAGKVSLSLAWISTRGSSSEVTLIEMSPF